MTTTLHSLLSPSALADSGRTMGPLGPPLPTPDEATGLELLKLPPGFRYRSFGWTGDDMLGGISTPPLHDGMGVIRQLGRWLVLVRNHEVNGGQPFGGSRTVYSPAAGGGTTNLIFNLRRGRWVRAFASLSGTQRNCTGGITPWGTWLTCEEVAATHTTAGGAFPHGYVFEVGPRGGSPKPLKAMGRFSHEAVAVDPSNGIVYETEDGPSAAGDEGSGFYRFHSRVPGRLARGGRLEMLKVAGHDQFDFRALPCDGTVFDVEWVDIHYPDPVVGWGQPSVFRQGFEAGGASFRRLEGCWFGQEKIFFVSTDGGPFTPSGGGEGQIYQYDPRRQTLEIVFASPHPEVLENPDNIVVAPNGWLLLCEDNTGPRVDGSNQPFNQGERLIFLDRRGQVFDFAFNNLDFTAAGLGPFRRPSGALFEQDHRQSEWAGATFSPDGTWLFVNIQTPGITFAITGPWPWTWEEEVASRRSHVPDPLV